MPISDLKGTLWKINSSNLTTVNFTQNQVYTFKLDYVSNDIKFSYLSFEIDGGELKNIYYHHTESNLLGGVFRESAWVNENYRDIIFDQNDNPNATMSNADLIAWFEANATLVSSSAKLVSIYYFVTNLDYSGPNYVIVVDNTSSFVATFTGILGYVPSTDPSDYTLSSGGGVISNISSSNGTVSITINAITSTVGMSITTSGEIDYCNLTWVLEGIETPNVSQIQRGSSKTIDLVASSGYYFANGMQPQISGTYDSYVLNIDQNDSTKAKLTINNVRSDLTIVMNAPLIDEVFDITLDLSHATKVSGPTSVVLGNNATFVFNATYGYNLLEPTIVGDIENKSWTLNGNSGTLIVYGVTSDLTIYVVGSNLYSITYNLTNLTYEGVLEIEYYTSTEIKLIPTDTIHFTYPSSITTTNSSYRYDDLTGIINLSRVTGNVLITASARRIAYDIVYQIGKGIEKPLIDIVSVDDITTIQLVAKDHYDFPSSITINGAMGIAGNVGCTWTYNTTTGIITIQNPTTDLIIELDASQSTKSYETLQEAVQKFIGEKLNDTYWQIVDSANTISDHYNYFKCSTIYDFNYDGFEQYDKDNQIILKEDNFHERYIPTLLGAVSGDREPIPNAFISEVIIPIEMIVSLDTVEIAIKVLTELSNNTIGKVFILDFVDTYGNYFNFSFVPDLPNFDDFEIAQGETTKIVSIMLSGVVSANINYGNGITYSLSYDGGSTYESLIKVNPATARTNDIYQDQVIGEKYTKGLVKTSTWSKTLTIYAFKNSKLAKLLMLLVDMPFATIKTFDSTNFGNISVLDWKLKTNYQWGDEPEIEYIKPILIDEISYVDDIGSFMTITFSMKDRF